MEVEFTRGSRKHKVGRERARQVLAQPFGVFEIEPKKWLVIGDDLSGRSLEIVFIDAPDGTFLVIHVMDLRPKYWGLYNSMKEGR